MRGIKIYGISSVPKGMFGQVGMMQICYTDKEKAEEKCQELKDKEKETEYDIIELILTGVAFMIKGDVPE